MTTHKEALKLALEAMRGLYGGWRCKSAIKACEEALAQQSNEQVEPDCWAESDKEGNIVWGENCFSDDPEWLDNPMPLFSHPPVPTAQPEQEPDVYIPADALRQLKGTSLLILRSVPLYGYRGDGLIPLYTTPPQRKPLTDEQIAHATAPVFMGGEPSLTGIARAIEAAHGIKE